MKQLRASQARRELCRYAASFYHRGWMPGTSGNLSIKVADRPITLAITPSSVDKGGLTPRDIFLVTAAGATRHGRASTRPSAETAIHLALYEAFPTCGAVFHVHTVHSTLVATRHVRRGVVTAKGLEMLKGFQTLAPRATPEIPIFPNIDNLDDFARRVRRQARQLANIPGFLIAHHGMTAWGRDAQEAEKHLELLEFLCHYLWEMGDPARGSVRTGSCTGRAGTVSARLCGGRARPSSAATIGHAGADRAVPAGRPPSRG